MGDIELDGAAATRLEIDKQQPVPRPQQVARMRLAVQQLLVGAAVVDCAPQVSQGLGQKVPLRAGKLGGLGAVADQPLRLCDSIREAWRRHIDLPHAGMQPLERLRILGWRDVFRRHTLVVCPQGDREAVTHVDARLHPRVKLAHWAVGLGELPSDVDFELGTCLVRYMRDPSKNVTRKQAHSEPVRVAKNNRVSDPHVECRGRGHRRSHRSPNF
jgi:hypothetical protein